WCERRGRMESRFDEFAKALAGGISRREALRRIGGAGAGAMLASLGLAKAWGQGNSQCAQVCGAMYPPGPLRGQCTRDAALGRGICYECGPAAPPSAQALFCQMVAGPVCCNSGQGCSNGQCVAVTDCFAEVPCPGSSTVGCLYFNLAQGGT